MRKIDLYINNQKADFSDESFILFNYAFNDLNNPAVVRNSFSREIDLPGTPANIRIFAHFGRLDRVTGAGFNAFAKEPFTIYSDDGRILESGYVRLDSVEGGKYTITLFGGLGSLFYGLAFREDGTKVTLADLSYDNGNGETFDKDSAFDLDLPFFWDCLKDGTTNEMEDIINFVPMYNGIPSENFDAKTAVVRSGLFDNLPGYIVSGGVRYEPKGGVSQPYTIAFGSAKTEWEVNDLRDYLQRPVVNVKKLLGAIANSAPTLTGKLLVFDASVWSIDGIEDMWMTLPILKTEKRGTALTLGDVLEDTMSPSAFIIGFAKAFGLVFIADPEKITMMTRDKAFATSSAEVIDLTDRIDLSHAPKVTPTYAEAKFYDFAIPGVGATAKMYKEQTERELGSVRVDTNYPFNDDAEDLLKGTPFKVASVLARQSRGYITAYFTPDGDMVDQEYLPIASYDTIKAKMFPVGSNESKELEISTPPAIVAEDTYLFYDWLARVEGCDSSNKTEDASGIILKFNGFVDAPEVEYDDAEGTTITFDPKQYHLTSYNATRIALNGGVDCWDLRTSGHERSDLPKFTLALNGSIAYNTRWRDYITDLYDKDSFKMECRCDLSGLVVGDSLLTRFFWYDGSLWVLNKITNYSLTTFDPAECEFVRVQDVTRYTNGQN